MAGATAQGRLYTKECVVNRPLRIAITTGDADGIGTEIVSKALQKLKPQKGVQIILWRSHKCPDRDLRRIDSAFHRRTVNSWPEALSHKEASYKEIIDIRSNQRPPVWVETCGQAAMYGHIDAIATAPLSKTEIISCGMEDIGHTEILKRIAQVDNTHMAFVGSKFNVVLATGHASVIDAISQLNDTRLFSAILAADQLVPLLPTRKIRRPIAVVGLNPHAGEGGLIGNEEVDFFNKALKKARKMEIAVEGPLVPDAAFFEENWKKYSAFVCPLHDHGLIPFKLVHERSGGVHITLGLPFIRTSVDHGTAKNIFGKNIADPSSMLESIRWAIRLSKNALNQPAKVRSTRKKGSGQ